MTDNDDDSALPEDETLAEVLSKAAPKDNGNKQKWGTVAVGVGSTALVAALMYATRSRRKK